MESATGMGPLADGLHAVAQSTASERPDVGRWVRVDQGRRTGVEGRVLRHVRDQFNTWKWRYGSDAQAMMKDILGKYGFRVQVETATHGTFWIDAEKVTVCGEGD